MTAATQAAVERAPSESEYTVEMVLNEWIDWAWRRGREWFVFKPMAMRTPSAWAGFAAQSNAEALDIRCNHCGTQYASKLYKICPSCEKQAINRILEVMRFDFFVKYHEDTCDDEVIAGFKYVEDAWIFADQWAPITMRRGHKVRYFVTDVNGQEQSR